MRLFCFRRGAECLPTDSSEHEQVSAIIPLLADGFSFLHFFQLTGVHFKARLMHGRTGMNDLVFHTISRSCQQQCSTLAGCYFLRLASLYPYISTIHFRALHIVTSRSNPVLNPTPCVILDLITPLQPTDASFRLLCWSGPRTRGRPGGSGEGGEVEGGEAPRGGPAAAPPRGHVTIGDAASITGARYCRNDLQWRPRCEDGPRGRPCPRAAPQRSCGDRRHGPSWSGVNWQMVATDAVGTGESVMRVCSVY